MKRLIHSGKTGLHSDLIKPRRMNAVTLYYWSPGYFLRDVAQLESGKTVQKSKFIPTSTFTAAVSLPTQRYGPQGLLNHKRDLSPGHVSVAAYESYLSVGPEIDPIESQHVSLTSTHKLYCSPSLRDDIFGLERIPECVDFHCLNTTLVDNFIKDTLLKKPTTLYTMLGERYALSEGDSCATAAYRCLSKGGLSELLSFLPYKVLSEKSIITPTSLKEYSEIAKAYEHERYPEAKKLSSEFQAHYQSDMKKISVQLNRFLNSTEEASRQDAPPPKPQ